jgi:subtilisin family serine protease
MSMRALWLAGLLCVANPAAQGVPQLVEPQPLQASVDDAAQRQVLLMLKVAPAHYTPGGRYGDDYANAPGRVARRHLADAIAREHGLVLRDEWPMPALGVDCFVLDAADHATAVRQAGALAADPRVESAEAMQVFHALGAPESPVTDPLYAVQPVARAWHLDELHAHATGKGVRVAVVDSGVARDHPDLRGQVALSRDFVSRQDNNPGGEAHGTEVAGIIAAIGGNGLGIVGIAPQARLLALRACWERGGGAAAACSSFTLAQALQFAIDSRVQVLNLSLTGPSDHLLARLLDVALARGISIVGAVDASAPDGGFPASHPGVLAVDGLTNIARIASVRAPSDGIPATRADGSWGLVSGTSFAAAQVSGLVALVRQENPRLGPAQLLTAMAPTRTVLSPTERPRAINACAVMQRASGHCVCACTIASIAR